MAKKVYRVGTGVRLNCDCCVTVCDQSFLAVTDERPFISPDFPLDDPVSNTDLAFDGDVSVANTNKDYYTSWEAHPDDSTTYTSNGNSLALRGHRWEFGYEFPVGQIEGIRFIGAWRSNIGDGTSGKVVLRIYDAEGNETDVDMTSEWNSTYLGLNITDHNGNTSTFDVDVSTVGPIKSIAVLQGNPNGTSAGAAPTWIRFVEIQAVSDDCTEPCEDYAYSSPQEFIDCDGTPYLMDLFAIAGTGLSWNSATTVLVSSSHNGTGVLTDTGNGTLQYTPGTNDTDIVITATFTDTAAPGGCEAVITINLTCACAPTCACCNPAPDCPITMQLTGEDLQGTSLAYDISGGSLTCSPASPCPIELPKPSAGNSAEIRIEIVWSETVACASTNTEQPVAITYSNAAELQQGIEEQLEAFMLGDWSVTVVDNVTSFSVTAFSGTNSRRVLCELSVWDDVNGKDQYWDSITNDVYQHQCILDTASTTNLFTGPTVHTPDTACVFEIVESLSCGGTLTGTLNLCDLIFDVTGGSFYGTQYSATGSINMYITYSDNEFCTGSPTTSPTETLYYDDEDSFRTHIEQYLQRHIGGNWTAVITDTGNLSLSGLTGSNAKYALCNLVMIQGASTGQNFPFVVSGGLSMTYEFVVRDSSNTELISAKYASISDDDGCYPFDCGAEHPFEIIYYNNGTDANGNSLAELQDTAGTFNIGKGSSSCSNPVALTAAIELLTPDIELDWNNDDDFVIDLEYWTTAQEGVGSPTYSVVSEDGEGSASIVGSVLTYSVSIDDSPVNIIYEVRYSDLIKRGTITLNFPSDELPVCQAGSLPFSTAGTCYSFSGFGTSTEIIDFNNYISGQPSAWAGHTEYPSSSNPQLRFPVSTNANGAFYAESNGDIRLIREVSQPNERTRITSNTTGQSCAEFYGYTLLNTDFGFHTCFTFIDNGHDLALTPWVNVFELWQESDVGQALEVHIRSGSIWRIYYTGQGHPEEYVDVAYSGDSHWIDVEYNGDYVSGLANYTFTAASTSSVTILGDHEDEFPVDSYIHLLPSDEKILITASNFNGVGTVLDFDLTNPPSVTPTSSVQGTGYAKVWIDGSLALNLPVGTATANYFVSVSHPDPLGPFPHMAQLYSYNPNGTIEAIWHNFAWYEL